MAGWSELLEAKLPALPKQVLLCTGETSSALVWDKLHQVLDGYEMHIRIGSVEDLTYASFGVGNNLAYVAVDPSDEILAKIEEVIRGGCIESFYVLMSGASLPKTDSVEYIKKKAQQSKRYYTVTVPKSEAAQGKMVSFFMFRWGVTKDQAHRVCALLDFSPAKLYLFDIQFMSVIGSSILSSVEARKLIDELLGTESANLVVQYVFDGTSIDGKYSPEFNRQVLGFITEMVNSALAIKAAWANGATSMSAVCKESGISQFQASRAWGLAQAYNEEKLKKSRHHLALGFKYAEQPDMLDVLSRIF